MRIKRHILSLTIILVILFILFIGVANRLISSYVNDSSIFKKKYENVAALPRGPAETFLQKPEDNALIPQDPAQYNIQVFADRDLRLSEAQWGADIWDTYMKNALRNSKSAGPMGEDRILAEGEKTPKELKERLSRINRQIKELEKTGRENSRNQVEEIKLQSLYILKSSLTALNDFY